jgi:DNA-directed RNA polymerase sigma subunit (sigma70/sigma32)
MARNRADLNDMEQIVIRERFALDADPDLARPKTLEQVGEMIGVTKERVRQIQNKALRKIRTILEDNYLAA